MERENYGIDAPTVVRNMALGQYCNVLKGQLNSAKTACSGEVISVGADGRIQANVPASDAFAIHHQAKISSSQPPQSGNYQRTVVFIQAQTQSGQDMFVRGGLDHVVAQQQLGLTCTAANLLCAMPIRHRNLKNATTTPWKTNDNFLDWYGREASQNAAAEGTALDWTTNSWPAGWGAWVHGSSPCPCRTSCGQTKRV